MNEARLQEIGDECCYMADELYEAEMKTLGDDLMNISNRIEDILHFERTAK